MKKYGNYLVKSVCETLVGYGASVSRCVLNSLGFSIVAKTGEATSVGYKFLHRTTLTLSNRCMAEHRYENYRVYLYRFLKNCYRGFCHERGLPVRGQRTRSNYRTQTKLFSRRLAFTPTKR